MIVIKRLISFLIVFVIVMGISISANSSQTQLTSSGNTEETLNSILIYNKFYNNSQNADIVSQLVTLDILFIGDTNMTANEQVPVSYALKLAYRIANKEDEANSAGTNTGLRQELGMSTYGIYAWSDGFFITAFKDGLISKDEFSQAFSDENYGFEKYGALTVGRFMDWLSILLGSSPRQNNVDPTLKLTKVMLPSIIQCFWNDLLNFHNIEERTGKITELNIEKGKDKTKKTFTIKKADDTYDTIRVETPANVESNFKNDILVLGKGNLELTACLHMNDEITYYVINDKVKYIKVTKTKNISSYKPSCVYRGTMFIYDNNANSVIINDPYVLINNKFVPLTRPIVLYLLPDAKIINNGNYCELRGINDLILDKEVYVYTKSCYPGSFDSVFSIISK